MTEKHLKELSMSLVIMEMQIEMTLRFHLTPIRIAEIKISSDSTWYRGSGAKVTFLNCWWECKLVQAPW